MKLSQLVFDKSLFPRGGVNYVHVGDLVNALLSGATFPPLLIDAATNRIIDGVHRYHAYLKAYGLDYEVEVDAQEFADEDAIWMAAVEANADHGLGYTTYDRTLILVEAEKRGISHTTIAILIRIPAGKAVKKLDSTSGFVKNISGGRDRVALRTAMKGLAGKTLNRKQEEANKRVGMKANYHAAALIELLDAGLLKWATPSVVASVTSLYKKLDAQMSS